METENLRFIRIKVRSANCTIKSKGRSMNDVNSLSQSLLFGVCKLELQEPQGKKFSHRTFQSRGENDLKITDRECTGKSEVQVVFSLQGRALAALYFNNRLLLFWIQMAFPMD